MIRTSNVCGEIVQYASKDDTATCVLASLVLPSFLTSDGTLDLDAVHTTTKLAVRGLDALIDIATYPTSESQACAVQMRAIGVGVQGLADVFMAIRLPYSSVQARVVNRDVFETVYHTAYQSSNELAETRGPYPLYAGSPASYGQLQHDMWSNVVCSGRYDFLSLRDNIQQHGLRNSVMTVQIGAASGSTIMRNCAGTEPYRT